MFDAYDFVDSNKFAGKIILTSFPGLNDEGKFDNNILASQLELFSKNQCSSITSFVEDKEFDKLLDKSGWLRLTTINQYVYHIGNRVTGVWRDLLEKVDYSRQSIRGTEERELSPVMLFILGFPPVKKFVLLMYNFFFNLVYRIR